MTPQQFLQNPDPEPIKSILKLFLYSDLSQIKFQPRFDQIIQLIQILLQYFIASSDFYAEATKMKSKIIQQQMLEISRLKQQCEELCLHPQLNKEFLMIQEQKEVIEKLVKENQKLKIQCGKNASDKDIKKQINYKDLQKNNQINDKINTKQGTIVDPYIDKNVRDRDDDDSSSENNVNIDGKNDQEGSQEGSDIKKQQEQNKIDDKNQKQQDKINNDSEMLKELIQQLPKCNICGKVFINDEKLIQHINRRHPEQNNEQQYDNMAPNQMLEKYNQQQKQIEQLQQKLQTQLKQQQKHQIDQQIVLSQQNDKSLQQNSFSIGSESQEKLDNLKKTLQQVQNTVNKTIQYDEKSIDQSLSDNKSQKVLSLAQSSQLENQTIQQKKEQQQPISITFQSYQTSLTVEESIEKMLNAMSE